MGRDHEMRRAGKLGYRRAGKALAKEHIETPYRLASSGWTPTAVILASSAAVSTPLRGAGGIFLCGTSLVTVAVCMIPAPYRLAAFASGRSGNFSRARVKQRVSGGGK
jgi:hypothetical protein